MTIAARYVTVTQAIANACRESNRDPGSVRLVAVAKTHPMASVVAAVAAGARDIGENYAQEGIAKVRAVNEALGWEAAKPEWHFVGSLQSNKASAVARAFSWIHALDRESLAKSLNMAQAELRAPSKILVQVNIDKEASKSGLLPADLNGFLDLCQKKFPALQIVGLTCIPRAANSAVENQRAFARMRELASDARNRGLYSTSLNELSMGMSDDFCDAIRAGATIVRIGTAIFGPRQSKAV